MATLLAVTAGFTVIPSRDRERDYLRYLVRQGDPFVPLEDALFDIRTTDEGEHVILLPFRSYEAARRIQKAFDKASKAHQKAERQRAQFEVAED